MPEPPPVPRTLACALRPAFGVAPRDTWMPATADALHVAA
jgi:hypothetical protein